MQTISNSKKSMFYATEILANITNHRWMPGNIVIQNIRSEFGFLDASSILSQLSLHHDIFQRACSDTTTNLENILRSLNFRRTYCIQSIFSHIIHFVWICIIPMSEFVHRCAGTTIYHVASFHQVTKIDTFHSWGKDMMSGLIFGLRPANERCL